MKDTPSKLPQKEYVSKQVGKAIARYKMLADGDKLMVAVSGGMDSMALFYLLRYRQTFIPIDLELTAVYVDMGIPGMDVEALRSFFKEQRVPFKCEKVEVFYDKPWDEIDCYSCAQLRKKALFEAAERLGFRKIATGHHLDDIAETILMNLFYRGEIGAMNPCQYLFDGKYTIIRPMAFVKKSSVEALVEKEKIFYLPKHNCPNSHDTKRAYVKGLLDTVDRDNPHVKKNIVTALQNIKKEYLT